MAVAPVDKNGKADYSEVVIAYTGTNKDGNAVQDIIGADLGGIGMGFGIPIVIMSK
ncbi:hypothetical protein HO422_10805 [Streptococcus suis]|nr:hypothetical protein [Streptococcus suis]